MLRANAPAPSRSAAAIPGNANIALRHRAPLTARPQQRAASAAASTKAVAGPMSTAPPPAAATDAAAKALLSPQKSVRDLNAYLLRALEAHDDEKAEIISRLRFVVAAQRSAADVRVELHQAQADLAASRRETEELRLALQEAREAQRRLESENLVYRAQNADDRAKIEALAALCRAEVRPAAGPNGVVMLSIDGRHPQAALGATRRDALWREGGTREQQQHQHQQQNDSLSLRAAASSAGSPPGATPGTAAPPRSVNTSIGAGLCDSRADGPLGGEHVAPLNDRIEAAIQRCLGLTASATPTMNGTAPPSQHLHALTHAAGTLQTLLMEQRAAYEAARSALTRNARDAEVRALAEQTRMEKEIRSLSDVVAASTQDLCTQRQQTRTMERGLRAQIDALVQRAYDAEEAHRALSVRLTEELRVAAARAREQGGSVQGRLRQQVADLERRLHAVQDAAAKDVTDLREQLRVAVAAAERERRIRVRVESHRALDAEGRRSDVGLLRQQLRELEKRAYFSHLASPMAHGCAVDGADADDNDDGMYGGEEDDASVVEATEAAAVVDGVATGESATSDPAAGNAVSSAPAAGGGAPPEPRASRVLSTPAAPVPTAAAGGGSDSGHPPLYPRRHADVHHAGAAEFGSDMLNFPWRQPPS